MTATAEDFQALREVEVEWLSAELSRAISNLSYPVGMGVAPYPAHIKSAAGYLFERYARMIEMAHTAALTHADSHGIENKEGGAS